MPNISKPPSANGGHGLARIGVTVCTLVLVAVTALGLWRAMAATLPKAHFVAMENMKFSPAALNIQIGDQVVFKNQDLVPHTATAKTGETFDSGALKNGEEWIFTATRAGAIRYVCAFHPMMEGSIVISSE